MPDELDLADAQAAQTLERELAAQKKRAASAPKLQPSGECQNERCGEEFPPGDQRLFCDSVCAAAHAKFSHH